MSPGQPPDQNSPPGILDLVQGAFQDRQQKQAEQAEDDSNALRNWRINLLTYLNPSSRPQDRLDAGQNLSYWTGEIVGKPYEEHKSQIDQKIAQTGHVMNLAGIAKQIQAAQGAPPAPSVLAGGGPAGATPAGLAGSADRSDTATPPQASSATDLMTPPPPVSPPVSQPSGLRTLAGMPPAPTAAPPVTPDISSPANAPPSATSASPPAPPAPPAEADSLSALNAAAAGAEAGPKTRRQKIAEGLIRFSQGMEGRFPAYEAEQQAQGQLRALALERQQYARQLLRDVHTGLMKPAEANAALRAYDLRGITGGRTGAGAVQEDYLIPVNPITGERLPAVNRDKHTGATTDARTGAPVDIPGDYILQRPSSYQPGATGGLKNLQLAYQAVTNQLTPEPDRKAAQAFIDKNAGPSGPVGNIYKALKMQNPKLPDEKVREMAGELYLQETGMRLNKMLLDMQINSYLSGQAIPQTFGTLPTTPPATAAPAAAPAAAPGAGGAAAPTAPPPPATTTTTAPPETPPPTEKPAGAVKPWTKGERRLVDNFIQSASKTGNISGGGRGAAAMGLQQGRELLIDRLGALGLLSDAASLGFEIKKYQADLDSVTDLEKLANAYNAVNRRIDYFATNFEATAKKINNISGEWLNTPWREIRQGVIGDPDITQYLMSLNALDRIYTQVTTSPTSNAQLPEGARTHIQGMLPPGMTLKQALSIKPQLHAEAQADREGFRSAVQDIREEIYNGPLGQALGAPQTGAGRAGGGGGGGGGGQVPTIDSKAEYDALPNGSKYIDKQDGKTYTKGR